MFVRFDSLRRSSRFRAPCFCNFICSALVIEVAGDVHDLQKEEDERREKVLSEMGLKINEFTLA